MGGNKHNSIGIIPFSNLLIKSIHDIHNKMKKFKKKNAKEGVTLWCIKVHFWLFWAWTKAICKGEVYLNWPRCIWSGWSGFKANFTGVSCWVLFCINTTFFLENQFQRCISPVLFDISPVQFDISPVLFDISAGYLKSHCSH